MTDADLVEVDDECLRRWPLPQPDADGDKEKRGRVLIIAGSREMPGAVILAANGALNAGAGKLTVVTVASVATLVATAFPEARVILPDRYGVTEAATQDWRFQAPARCWRV
ncbi:MAG: NAD(P)H-hydrate dehydratase [Burkholderiaceae bacterium]